MKWWARRRLRAKIFLPFSALIVAVLLATLWAIGAAIGGWVEGSLKRQFIVTGDVFRGLMAERADRLIGETKMLSFDFALKPAIVTHDPDTVLSVASNHRDRIGVELLWIADEKGRLLAGSDNVRGEAAPTAQPGRDLTALVPVADAMATDKPAVAVTELDGRLMQLAAVPVFGPGEETIGYLLAGEPIDDATARQLEASTGPAVSFLTPTRVFASSWSDAPRQELFPGGAIGPSALRGHLQRAAAAAQTEPATFLLRLPDNRLLSILIPVEARVGEPLFALVQDSYDRALGPLARLTWWVAMIGAAGVLAALVVGRLIAGGIAAPVQALVGAMRRVLTGDFRQRLAVRREDEIGFLADTFNEMVAGLEEREHIKETFGRFVSRDVAAAVLSGSLPLDGERREVTILFQDVRGFTSLAEGTDPPVLVRIVNALFTEMVAAVEAEGGIIRVFTGDGVMALFGAPVAHDDDPARAVRAALDMMARLPALSARVEAEGLPPLRIGIGIATGEVIVGRMGPDARSEYNVVGDAANLASRIEGLNKELGTTILISVATAARLGDEFHLGRRATLPVKGKELPVEVVEVLGCAPVARRTG
jgi:class 3 adenylate cyclase